MTGWAAWAGEAFSLVADLLVAAHVPFGGNVAPALKVLNSTVAGRQILAETGSVDGGRPKRVLFLVSRLPGHALTIPIPLLPEQPVVIVLDYRARRMHPAVLATVLAHELTHVADYRRPGASFDAEAQAARERHAYLRGVHVAMELVNRGEFPIPMENSYEYHANADIRHLLAMWRGDPLDWNARTMAGREKIRQSNLHRANNPGADALWAYFELREQLGVKLIEALPADTPLDDVARREDRAMRESKDSAGAQVEPAGVGDPSIVIKAEDVVSSVAQGDSRSAVPGGRTLPAVKAQEVGPVATAVITEDPLSWQALETAKAVCAGKGWPSTDTFLKRWAESDEKTRKAVFEASRATHGCEERVLSELSRQTTVTKEQLQSWVHASTRQTPPWYDPCIDPGNSCLKNR